MTESNQLINYFDIIEKIGYERIKWLQDLVFQKSLIGYSGTIDELIERNGFETTNRLFKDLGFFLKEENGKIMLNGSKVVRIHGIQIRAPIQNTIYETNNNLKTKPIQTSDINFHPENPCGVGLYIGNINYTYGFEKHLESLYDNNPFLTRDDMPEYKIVNVKIPSKAYIVIPENQKSPIEGSIKIRSNIIKMELPDLSSKIHKKNFPYHPKRINEFKCRS